MGSKKILIVEDDLNLGFLLMDLLESQEYQVKLCRNGKSALESLRKDNYDLCLLDVMMPELDGFSVAQNLIAQNNTIPFIFITARSLKDDKLKGYDLGAEDYITKPFDEEVLLCKIKAILKRTCTEEDCSIQSNFEIGESIFIYERSELIINDETHRLTEKENEVLRLLCLNMNKILRREDAVLKIYGKKDYFLGRSFDVYISRLRKLFKKDPSVEIENIYKVGFMLQETNIAK